MASVYDQLNTKSGIRYRKDKQLMKKADVPANVMEVLTDQNIVDENGLVIVEDKGDFGKTDTAPNKDTEVDENANSNGTDTDKAPIEPVNAPVTPEATSKTRDAETPVLAPSLPEAAAQKLADTPARSFKSKTPQSKPGMGYPRVNGKTVDIFDGVTPHTHVRSVGGHIVPLSAESYRTKTDSEIETRLREMGFEIVDLNAFELSAELKAANGFAETDVTDDTL